ncbi:MAG: hypothetical protein WA156_17270 [Methylocystis silviterrae]
MKLVAIAFALVCNTVEPMHAYHEKKVEDLKWGLDRSSTVGFFDQSCHRIFKNTSVEVVEQTPAPDYPFIVKLRYTDPKEFILDENNGKVIGKGVTHDVYGEISDFADKMPEIVVPKPSPEVLARRKRIEDLKQTWGLPGAVLVTEE